MNDESRVKPPESRRSPVSNAEASEESPGLHRRGFLQGAGFGLMAATACSRPEMRPARPFLEAPEEVTPGRASAYASVCGGCSAGCGVLAKVRDGRPIKLEGLDDHPLSGGGLCAMGQASLLGLYDRHRPSSPRLAGTQVDWPEVDRAVRSALDAARSSGRKIRLLSDTLLGPTEIAAADRFVRSWGGRHVVHDPISASAILDAHQRTHGERLLPRLLFDRASVIVGIDADFLGTWISPVEHTTAYQRGRRPDDQPTRRTFHAQLEPILTLTGSNADLRVPVAPETIAPLVAALEAVVTGSPGVDPPSGLEQTVARLAEELQRAGPEGLLVCGSDDPDVQVLVNSIHHHLGSYGTCLDTERASRQRRGDDGAFHRLVDELRAGEVGVLVISGTDPVQQWAGAGLEEALRSVDLLVALTPHLDATASLADAVCPVPHYLEAWGDAEAVDGVLSIRQPTIEPFFDCRSARASLAAWSLDAAGGEDGGLRDDLAAIQEHWREQLWPRVSQSSEPRDFQRFWDQTLHDGFAELPVPGTRPRDPDPSTLFREADRSRKALERSITEVGSGGALSLVLHPTVAMGWGRHADNPWLQELPDPIARTSWGNHAALAPATAAGLGVENGDLIRVHAGGASIELPTLVQPGQHESVVAVAMGYGDPRSERFHDAHPPWIGAEPSVGEDGRVGVNGAVLVSDTTGGPTGVEITAVGRRRELARIQTYDRLSPPEETTPPGQQRRPFVETVDLVALASAGHGAEQHDDGGHHDLSADLYPDDHPSDDGRNGARHRWGMTIDLDACTGCGACVIACQAENNLPVVGRDEMRRGRDMHWLRIDRYYDGPDEEPSPTVSFQPMLCQHCDQAPCETVCPVLATVQTAEGLNAQAYNRCVGTRYCANNCPFKVRRFNWLDYVRDDPMANLVLNPDVVVRSRGVMEKCTFCVQRLENAKMEARRRGDERVRDDEVRPACQQSCPAQAIVLGDILDEDSEVVRRKRSPRSYRLLEELAVGPSVDYLKKVRRAPETLDEHTDPEEDSHG